MNIIETNHLHYKYGKRVVLQDVGLKVEQGSIYGYLGKNGAGKTTTLKILVGLLSNFEGEVLLYGKNFQSHRIANLRKIGNIIEKQSLYEQFTVYEQLKYFDILYKKGDRSITEIVRLTGLEKEKDKKIKHLSTGMQQRLGIGVALFHDPDLLILDEPINGLDPEGFYDVRQLLLRMQECGKTIILSSHILSEIEKTCTHVGILDKGRLIYQGQMSELLFSTQKKVIVYCSDVPKATRILNEQAISTSVINNDSFYYHIQNGSEFNKAFVLLVNHVEIFNIETVNDSLEDIFIHITSHEQ
jgi:ABC-2 type transport system ATP-binding protein